MSVRRRIVECTAGHKAACREMSRGKIKKYHWFNRYVNADGHEKVEPSSAFAKTLAITTYVYERITYVNT